MAFPRNDEARLNCGVMALVEPVSYGEPWAGSAGYRSMSLSMSSSGAVGSQVD